MPRRRRPGIVGSSRSFRSGSCLPCRGTVVDANPALIAMFAMPTSRASGRPGWPRCTWTWPSGAFQEAIGHDRSSPTSTSPSPPDGSQFWSGSTPGGGVRRDRRLRGRPAGRLRLRRAEDAVRRRGAGVCGEAREAAAHEINNPLAIITGRPAAASAHAHRWRDRPEDQRRRSRPPYREIVSICYGSRAEERPTSRHARHPPVVRRHGAAMMLADAACVVRFRRRPDLLL